MTPSGPAPLDLLALPEDLASIRERLLHGRPIDVADVVRLLRHDDVLAVGAMAGEVARRRWRERAFYGRPLVLPLDSPCSGACSVCAGLWSGVGGFGAEARTRLLRDTMPTEVHLLGMAALPLPALEEALREVRACLPLAWVQGGTVSDVARLSREAGVPIEEAAERLQRAGLDALQGGEEEVCTAAGWSLRGSSEEPSFEETLAWHAAAHAAGLTSVATFRYDADTPPDVLAARLDAIRQVQQRVAGFTVVSPVSTASHPWDLVPATDAILPGFEDLRVLAVTRLAIDNIPHVRMPWKVLGLKMGPVALAFGADDLGRMPLDPHVRAFSPPSAFVGLQEAELLRAIRSAGLRGACVDGAFRPLPSPPPGAPEGRA